MGEEAGDACLGKLEAKPVAEKKHQGIILLCLWESRFHEKKLGY